MLRYTRWMKRGAFVVLLTVAVILGPARNAMAFPCSYSGGSGQTVSIWACGWFGTDPCSDGTAESICDYLCWQYYSGPLTWMTSCQSSDGGNGWWLSWAECACY